MRDRVHLPTRWLKSLSTASLVVGVLLLLSPFVEEVYTGGVVGEVQTEALANWEHHAVGIGTPAGHQARSLSTGLVLTIPRLGFRRFVPDGATPEHLRSYGVGRISWTAPPDAPGMLGIAGHRTTYGAPFLRVDQLHGGDSILVEYRGHRYTYQVSGRKTVRPQQVDVLQQEGGRQEIALVTCTPPYSAAFRLVVFGRLQRVTDLVRQ